MTRSKLDYNKQINFCEELLKRLKVDIKESMDRYQTNNIPYSLDNHSRMQNDIVRLRRELMNLSKMLDN